jgi:hypothetical protein
MCDRNLGSQWFLDAFRRKCAEGVGRRETI